MAFGRHKRAVGAFPTREEAERALDELRNSGFPMDRVTVIGPDEDKGEKIAGAEVKHHVDNQARTGAGAGAVTGTALGAAGGILLGLGALVIPGAGPFLAAGALATSFAGAGIGAAGGAIIGGLVGLGIPKDRAKAYSDSLSSGGYLVIVDGSEEEISRAEAVLSNRGIQEWGIYDAAEPTTVAQVPAYDTNPNLPNTTPTAYDTTEPVVTGNRVDTISSNSDVVEVIDHRNEVL